MILIVVNISEICLLAYLVVKDLYNESRHGNMRINTAINIERDRTFISQVIHIGSAYSMLIYLQEYELKLKHSQI